MVGAVENPNRTIQVKQLKKNISDCYGNERLEF